MGGEKASCALNREARGAAMGLFCRVPRDREKRWRGEEEVEMARRKGWAATFKGVLAAAIGGHGRLLQSTSLHRDKKEHTLDERFWHFLFGFGPGSLEKICSLMYTLQCLYRT
jgi:hypothetical protein